MKNLKFLSVLLLILSSCQKGNEPITFNTGSVIITGQIKNATEKTINIISLDMTGRENHSIRLNNDGCFYFTMDILGSHDNFLSYDNDLVTFSAGPNDSIYLTADGNEFEKTIKFSGDKSKFNQSLLLFFDELGKNIQTQKLFESHRTATPDEFKSMIINFNNNMSRVIDSIKKQIPHEKEAVHWMKSYLKYRCAEELFEFGRNFKGELPIDYYDFVTEYEEHEIGDLKCSQYYEDFIREYYFRYQFSKLNEFSQAQETLSKGKIYEGLNSIFDIVNNNVSDQIAKELILTKICVDIVKYNYKIVDSVYSKYSEIVQNQEYRNLIKQKIKEQTILSKEKRTIQDLITLEFVGKIFSEINEKHKGKVLYIDIWGTWCKGCVMQFPFSNELHDSLRTEPVEFVYLCCKSKKDDWEKSIEKFNLKGTHYLLTDDQYSVFSEEFDYTGFPSYMVIDKNGIIVDSKAKSPSDEKLKEELLALINK